MLIAARYGTRPDELMLIILGGLPGAGKTTISRVLAHRLGAVHVRIDSIEQAIQSRIVPMADAGYRVGYAVAEDNLRLGHIVIADSVNPIRVTRDAWLDVARRAGVTAMEVEIRCSDEDEHRRRVEAREADIAGLVLPTWAAVIAREYHPWRGEPIRIDTAHRTPEDCAEAIHSAIGARGEDVRE